MKTILALNSTLQAFSSADLPEELLLVPAGEFMGHDGCIWSSPNPQLVINATQDYGLDLAVDVEHATEIKGPKGEAAHAMAWIASADLYIRDGAIWAMYPLYLALV
jgi:phage I-like protein